MKLRTQRVFITLLAFLTVGIASVGAYTFNVVNRTPFGVLNLEKLILKPDTTHTGIIIDGSEYKIKIDPYHEMANGGQIRVYQICDENGENCKNVSNLYTGSQGIQGPQGATGAAGATGADGIGIQNISSSKNGKITTVTITYTNGGTASFQISDGADGTNGTNGSGTNYTLPEATSTSLGGVKLGSDNIQHVNPVATQAIQNRTYSIQKDEQGRLVVNVPWEDQDHYPDINGQNGYVCTKSGDNLDCTKAVKLGTMQDQKICYYNSGTKTLSCTQNQPGNRTINFKNASGTILYTFSLNDSGSALDIIRPSGVGGGGEPGPQGATGENGVSVVNAYTEGDNIVFKLSNDDTIVLTDVLVRLKGDQGIQGNTGAAGVGISEITTGKVNKTTTVTIKLTDNTTKSFDILDGLDGNGGDIQGIPNHRCTYQCEDTELTITWNSNCNSQNLNGNWPQCSEQRRKYEQGQGCSNPTTSSVCMDIAEEIYNMDNTRLTLSYNNNGGCSIVCEENAPSCEGQCSGGSGTTIYSGIQVTYHSGGKVCRYMTQEAVDNLKAGLDFNPGPVNGSGEIRCIFNDETGNGGGISIATNPAPTSGGYCVYVNSTTIRCNAEGGSEESNTYYYTITGGNITIQSGANVTVISGGSSDGLRTQIKDSNGNNVLTPLKNTNKLYLSNPTSSNVAAIRHENRLLIQKSGLQLASSPVEFNAKGAKFGNVSIARSFRSTDTSTAGVSIAGQLMLGNTYSNNYIYMYASGNAGNPNSHYEIKANKELAIGVDSGSFMYFKSYDNQDYLRYRVGINQQDPNATLDINGSIRVNTQLDPCIPTTCDDSNRGTILYRGDNFYGCTTDGWKKFTMETGSPNFNYTYTTCSQVQSAQIIPAEL